MFDNDSGRPGDAPRENPADSPVETDSEPGTVSAARAFEDDLADENVVPSWARKIKRSLEIPPAPPIPKPAGPEQPAGAGHPSATEAPRLPALPELPQRTEIRRLAIVTLYALDRAPDETVGEAIQRLEAMIPGAPEWPDGVYEWAKLYLDHCDQVNADISAALKNWTLERLGAVERAILRVGAAELRYCDDIPPKVTINECIELAKDYCDPASYKFINGVLDAVRRNLGKQDFEYRKSFLPQVRHRRRQQGPGASSSANHEPQDGGDWPHARD